MILRSARGDTEILLLGCIDTERGKFQALTANAAVATVRGSIPASSDTVESEARQMKQC